MAVVSFDRELKYHSDVVGLDSRTPRPTGRRRATPPAVPPEAHVTTPELSVLESVTVPVPVGVATNHELVSNSDPITLVMVDPSNVWARLRAVLKEPAPPPE